MANGDEQTGWFMLCLKSQWQNKHSYKTRDYWAAGNGAQEFVWCKFRLVSEEKGQKKETGEHMVGLSEERD